MVTTASLPPVASPEQSLNGKTSSVRAETSEVQLLLLAARHAQTEGNPTTALEMFERALRVAPMEPDLWVAAAEMLLEVQEQSAALDCVKQALLLESGHVDARVVLGDIQRQLGNIEEAESHYRTALSLQPDHSIALGSLASLLSAQDNHAAALPFYEQACQLAPRNPQLAFGYGDSLLKCGRLDDAQDYLIAALPDHPRPALVLHQLLETASPKELGQHRVSEWVRIASERAHDAEDRAHLHFALGKIADSNESYDQAFAHFRTANSSVPVAFDIEQHCHWVDETMAVWTAEFLHSRRRWGNPTDAPIFLVGMPRSGTSLVEQILSSHTNVQGLGERSAIRDEIISLLRSLGSESDCITTARRCTEADIHEFTERYLSIPNRDGSACFTDRTPTNFLHLGWIALCFPQAKIVHCQRDLRDVVLSCYSQHFRDRQPYAYDLTTLTQYALEAERLMNHWRTVLPGRIIDVSYESLVDQPNSEIQRLLSACDLPVESQCFEPHLNASSVVTASAWQMRKPIYTSSCRRWENYREHLQPLLDVLENPVLHSGI